MDFTIHILCSILFSLVHHPNGIRSQLHYRIDLNFVTKPLDFDSYDDITPLEDYPEVCSGYTDESCATSWLQEVHKVADRNENRLQNVAFQYSTNINEEHLKLQNTIQMEALKLNKNFRNKVEKFKWKSFKNAEIRRIFQMITLSKKSKSESIEQKIVKSGNEITFIYNNAQPCFKTCLEPGESAIRQLFRHETDYNKLIGFWTAWRNVTGAKIRDLFIKRMELENKGAKENGYSDAASFVLMNDFEDTKFKETVMKLFESILPLYKELHAYVRHCLSKHYPGKFDKNGAIPAHLLGNVWAQQWGNIFPIIKQCNGNMETNNFQKEVNEKLSKYSVNKMFKLAEQFYESIGMYKMTNVFWERSVLSQPACKLIDCHGTAYDFANNNDFRIIMCTKQNLQHFTTIHHEMGHIQYFMAYRDLPIIFRESANSGFHEAIGDTIALAVKTPEHLHKIGLISKIPKSKDFDIEYLLTAALEKIVFLPFALTMDSFIWGVYNGSVPTSELNKYWWDLRYRFQGLKPPVKRSENDFDPGAKYHVAFGVPYIRYFISFIIQFQFYESMCDISGHKGPLHRCDFFGSKEAGSKLLEMLKQGKSKHWKETMKILTGQNDIQAKSLLKFFEPLYKWLKDKNRELNISVGW